MQRYSPMCIKNVVDHPLDGTFHIETSRTQSPFPNTDSLVQTIITSDKTKSWKWNGRMTNKQMEHLHMSMIGCILLHGKETSYYPTNNIEAISLKYPDR